MTLHLRGRDRLTNQQVFERLFRLRHDIFVRQRQWSLPVRDGMDIDEYDCPDAAYFYDIDEKGSISTHIRLTPSATHSLLADYFPHLVEDNINPRGDTIWEGTRYIVRPSRKCVVENRRAKAQVIVAMLEWCKDNGVTHIQTVVDKHTFPTFLEMTKYTRPLGLPHPYGGGPDAPGGGECLAWRWPVTNEVISDIRTYGNLSTAK